MGGVRLLRMQASIAADGRGSGLSCIENRHGVFPVTTLPSYIVLPIHPPCRVVPVTRALMMHAHMQYATVNAVANGCNEGRNAGPIRGANHSRPRTSSSAATCYFGIFDSAGSYFPACDWLYCPCQISQRPSPPRPPRAQPPTRPGSRKAPVPSINLAALQIFWIAHASWYP